jgi:hypothetical protein
MRSAMHFGTNYFFEVDEKQDEYGGTIILSQNVAV